MNTPEILQKIASGKATESEKEAFHQWLQTLEVPARMQVMQELESYMVEAVVEENADEDLLVQIHKKIGQGKVISLRRTWYRIAAAAVILGVIATTYLVSVKRPDNIVTTADVKAPVGNRATITLSDGKTVFLDNATNGQLAMVGGNVQLVKLKDGQIAYSGTSDKVEYNTVTNPRGSKVIDLGFVDGSHVWINAGSSITYPVPFEKNERKVKITGEAYFEISHNAALPFKVSKDAIEVTVYGTHFNVKAYGNDADVQVTLLEGSVGVSANSKKQMLKPGEQAIVKTDNIQLVIEADTEQAMAWKNGYTSFHTADIQTVLKEIERWYDIATEVKGVLPDYTFYADVKRTAPLSDVLKVLEDNKVKYEYDAQKRKLTVLP